MAVAGGWRLILPGAAATAAPSLISQRKWGAPAWYRAEGAFHGASLALDEALDVVAVCMAKL